MNTNGICYNPDSLCEQEWMNHPLTYYRVKSKGRKEEQGGQQQGSGVQSKTDQCYRRDVGPSRVSNTQP